MAIEDDDSRGRNHHHEIEQDLSLLSVEDRPSASR